MKTTETKAISKSPKAARRAIEPGPEQWAIIERVGRIKALVLKNAPFGSAVRDVFTMYEQMDRKIDNQDCWKFYELAKRCWMELAALPQAETKRILEGWHFEPNFPTLKTMLADHAECNDTPQWWVTVTAGESQVNCWAEPVLDRGNVGLEVRIGIGMSKEETLRKLAKITATLLTHWDEVVGHDGTTNNRNSFQV
jgi:hypothetical protein